MCAHDCQIPLDVPDQVPVFSDETTEDLQRDGLRLIQKQCGFRYGEDAVLLAHYAAAHWLRHRRRPPAFVELGSQCGVVSILFAALVPGAAGVGLELIDRQVDVMRRNIELNRLTDRLRTVQGDIRALAQPGAELPDGLSHGCCDLVICNPPYGVPERGFPRTANNQAGYENQVAREEVACNFDEICRLSARLLKQRGRLILSHRPKRLPELMLTLQQHRLMPVQLLQVVPHAGDPPSVVLITAVRNGKPGAFDLMPPLVVRDGFGRYTEMARAFTDGPSGAAPAQPPADASGARKEI